MTIQEIIKDLTYYRGVFPRQAMLEAVGQREEITPELLHLLEDAATNIEDIALREDYVGHIFAMYLLAQFRETRACPVLVRFFSADQKLVEQATGDIITEGLGRLLASVCGGDIGLICSMVENAELDEYVRGAALEALVVLVAQGVKTRDEVMGYFKSLFHRKLKLDSNFVWSSLVSHCCNLYAGEVAEEIEQAFADRLIDTMFVGMEYVRRNLAEGEDVALERLARNPSKRFVEDAARELSGWSCYKDSQRSTIKTQPKQILSAGIKGRDRNAPCPCGSGKKYKKCCGAR